MTVFKIRDLSANNQAIYNLNLQLAVDEDIFSLERKRKLQALWTNNQVSALIFGRRIVEVASWNAMSAVSEFKGDTIDDLEKTANFADNAINSLNKFVCHLSGPLYGKKDGTGEPIPTRSILSYPIHRMRFRDAALKGQKMTGVETLKIGTFEAGALCNALESLQWISAYAHQTRNEVSKNYQNPGEPQKRAFAKTCIEGWIYLTGKLPSENNASFANFLSNAWNEACAKETNWTQAIRASRKEFVSSKVNCIAVNGPDWK